MNLSEHFTLEEMTHSEIGARKGYDNTPNEKEVANLRRLCGLLEKVKEVIGNKPVFINSGFRSKQVNDAVGSKDSSQHRLGCAADIRVPGMTPKQIISACILARLPYDQIILEFDSWVHISVPNTEADVPRNKALIIDKLGTRNY
jgi:zinc D-Ala-D-Ala carboxypeptidase